MTRGMRLVDLAVIVRTFSDIMIQPALTCIDGARKMISTGIICAAFLSAMGLTGCGAIDVNLSDLSQSVPSDAVVTLERTQCYGTCPSYKLTVSADGTVVFEGREYVKNKGTVRSNIGVEKVAELIK